MGALSDPERTDGNLPHDGAHDISRVLFLPCAWRKLPEAFRLSATKSCYPHCFNTEENLHYVGPIPNV